MIEPTNEERAERAYRALLARYDGSIEENIIDLLTDLQHLCPEYNISFSDCCALALIHYREESKR